MSAMKKFLAIVLFTLLTSCAPSNSTSPLNTPAESSKTEVTSHTSPKVYVSIVAHVEEQVHFEENEDKFNKFRENLVGLANMLYEEGTAFNFQSDWTLLLAATKFDKGDSSTNNKNFLRYLKEDLGFEIDPHAHETKYNYADVAYLINELGVEPSNIVGGLIAYPAEDSKLDYLQNEIKGNMYDYSWKAEVLWGAAVGGHKNESDLWVSGIWKPKDAENYTEDGGNLPNIGGYYNTWEGLDYLLSQDLDPNKIYTQTIFVSQGSVSKEFIEEFRAEIEKYKSDDRIIWVGLGEVIDIWESEYNSETNILKYDGDATGEREDKVSQNSNGKCGDGICDEIEKKICPQDC